MENENNEQIKELKDKMLREKTDGYYGITREWCVAKVTGDRLLGPSERDRYGSYAYSEDDLLMKMDFGKPRADMPRRSDERIGIPSYDVQEMVENVTNAVMESGTREDIVSEVIKKVKEDYELEVRFKTFTKGSDWMNHATNTLQRKIETPIATVENIKPYLSENEYDVNIYYEGINYYTPKNRYYGANAIKYLVNKILKEKYTYCVKMGKNIVPDEYIKLGKEGIDSWRREKISKNKNNSIEKQMLKKIKYQKKQDAFVTFNDVMAAMLNEKGSRNWDLAFLSVDGRWNTGRRLKTINKYILNVSDNELVTMSEEEIEKRCKSYWVAELTQAIERIKNLEFKKEEETEKKMPF